MNNKIKNGLLLFLLLVPAAVFAGETQRSMWLQILISWMPFIALLAIWIVYMRRSGINENKKYIDRSLKHMDSVEKLLEKIIEQNNNVKQL